MISFLYGLAFFAIIAVILIGAWLMDFLDRFKNKGA